MMGAYCMALKWIGRRPGPAAKLIWGTSSRILMFITSRKAVLYGPKTAWPLIRASGHMDASMSRHLRSKHVQTSETCPNMSRCVRKTSKGVIIYACDTLSKLQNMYSPSILQMVVLFICLGCLSVSLARLRFTCCVGSLLFPLLFGLVMFAMFF